MPPRTLGRRVVAATAPPIEAVWAKALAVERRLNNLFDANGVLRASDSAGNPFNGGAVAICRLAANAAQCASTGQSDTGLALPVVAGPLYWMDCDIPFAGQSANSAYLTASGPATSEFNLWIKYEQLLLTAQNSALHTTQLQATINANTSKNSNPLISGDQYWCHIQGSLAFTAGGTLKISQAASANAASFTVQRGAVMRLYYI